MFFLASKVFDLSNFKTNKSRRQKILKNVFGKRKCLNYLITVQLLNHEPTDRSGQADSTTSTTFWSESLKLKKISIHRLILMIRC